LTKAVSQGTQIQLIFSGLSVIMVVVCLISGNGNDTRNHHREESGITGPGQTVLSKFRIDNRYPVTNELTNNNMTEFP